MNARSHADRLIFNLIATSAKISRIVGIINYSDLNVRRSDRYTMDSNFSHTNCFSEKILRRRRFTLRKALKDFLLADAVVFLLSMPMTLTTILTLRWH